MKNYLLIFILCIITPLSIFAQTPKENLEKGVEIYNALREYIKTFTPATLNDENMADIKSRVDKGTDLLQKVVKEGNAAQIKAARYFMTNFKYEEGFMYGMKGNNKKAFEVFKGIESDITAYKSTDFPFNYEFFGKNFKVTWDNFAPTQAEYFTGQAEISYNLNKYEDAVRINKIAIEHPKLTPWLKYISFNKMLDIRNKNKDLISDDEYWDFAVRSIKAYADLTEGEWKTVKDNKYPTAERGANILFEQRNAMPTEKMVKYASEAAPVLTNIKYYSKAVKLFHFALEKSAALSISFHQDALRAAREAKKTQWETMDNADRNTTKQVASMAIAYLVPKIGTDCEKLNKYADDYTLFDETQKANDLRAKTAACLEEQKRKKAKEAEEKRKEEAQRKKEIYRREHPFNVYIGVDLVPLMTAPNKMDFGGHIDFRGRNVAHSLGGSLIKDKKDIVSGKSTWDGTRLFYAVKIFGSKQSTAYSGFYLGYADKKFDSIPAQIITVTSNPKTVFQNITMKDKQYEVMWNMGFQILGKGIGMDAFAGVGASYNKLSAMNSDYYGKPTDYSVQDNGTDFFEKRKKAESWNIKLRAGITFGLNFGSKRL